MQTSWCVQAALCCWLPVCMCRSKHVLSSVLGPAAECCQPSADCKALVKPLSCSAALQQPSTGMLRACACAGLHSERVRSRLPCCRADHSAHAICAPLPAASPLLCSVHSPFILLLLPSHWSSALSCLTAVSSAPEALAAKHAGQASLRASHPAACRPTARCGPCS